jgi:1-acyl-sn-glycerol-3-phosphate acyltransferase
MMLETVLIRIDFKIEYEGDTLSTSDSYLVICNHQSMADIPTLMKAVHGQIPFMRFFAKAQLKKVPIFGFAWRSVDYPFMQRYTKEFLEQNPHLKGRDLAEAIVSCRRLRHVPVAITNFIEGTRFTARKHEKQGKVYQYLLSPRAGGLALAIAALEGKLKTLIDVTIYYHQENHTLWDYLSGRLKTVSVYVRTIPVPQEFPLGDYQNDPVFREQFQAWLNTIWFEKDQRLITYHKKNAVA